MVDVSSRKRQVKGTPVGGQFAQEVRTEPTVSLTPLSGFDTKFAEIRDRGARLEALRAELDHRLDNIGTDENWLAFLNFSSQFYRYSVSNQLLIQYQTRGKATRVTSYKRWQELGRNVRKGERSIHILAPRHATVEEPDPKTGELRKVKKMVGFLSVPVFDVSQTEGEPLNDGRVELSETPPPGFIEDLETVIQGHGFSLETGDTGAAGGWTNFESKTVRISEGLTVAERARVLAHELGHIVGEHGERVSEYHTGAGGCRGEMEVEAESFAYTVCRANGMSTELGDVSGVYIASWSASAGKDQVRRSANKVNDMVKTSLQSYRWANAPEFEENMRKQEEVAA